MAADLTSNERLAKLPKLLRDAERRVNAHVFKTPGDSALCSIPANVDRDVDLLLIEAASAIELFCRPVVETEAESDVRVLRAALERIFKWAGEFPPTGRKWDDGTPMSYAACYGSNGERDFMRGIALEALDATERRALKSNCRPDPSAADHPGSTAAPALRANEGSTPSGPACPQCKTELAWEGDVCGLCFPVAQP